MKNFQDFGFELAKNTPLKMKIVQDFGSEKDYVEALNTGNRLQGRKYFFLTNIHG